MNARDLTFQFMKEICLQKRYSNLLLRNELDKANPKDKGLITQIVYGTLQNYRLCRYQWSSYVHKIPDEEVCVLLDMSVYQLLYMDKVPAYAIINETVEIAKKRIHESYAKLVNAVLHKVASNKALEIKGDPMEILAIKTSHPTWLVSMWSAQYGFETAEKICLSDMEIRASVARINTLKIDRETFLKDHQNYEAGLLSPSAVIYHGSSLAQTTEYQEGNLSIQDEASQLIAFEMNPQPNERILDVCSAPGTKACHMAELMKDKGEIWCGDLHEHRVKLVHEGALRLGLTNIKAMVMDATNLRVVKQQEFDRVLCDVPCSGYGVLSRKSDIKYHMQSSDMDTLIPLQRDILETSSEHVKKGGVLMYSTCTLNKKENEKQIEWFLKKRQEFSLEKQWTLFPYEASSDGFYMAKMVRNG